MIELEPIKFSDYMDLEPEQRAEYDFAIKYAYKYTRPVNEYNMQDIYEFSFGIIKDLQYYLEHGITPAKLVDYLCLFAGLKTLAKQPLDKVMRFKNYILQELEALTNAERKMLAGQEPSEHAYGLFQETGIYLQFRALHQGDVTKHQAVYDTPYHVCFTELVTQAELAELNRRVAEAQKIKS